MRPGFHWKGSSEDVKGVATFKLENESLELELGDLRTANTLYDFITNAYEDGARHARKNLAQVVMEAVISSRVGGNP